MPTRIRFGFEALVGYSRAVRVGNLVVVVGTAGAGDDIVARDSKRFADTDISRWREVGTVHAEVFRDLRPVATMVEVSALISPDLYVGIEADAHVD